MDRFAVLHRCRGIFSLNDRSTCHWIPKDCLDNTFQGHLLYNRSHTLITKKNNLFLNTYDIHFRMTVIVVARICFHPLPRVPKVYPSL